MKVLLLTTHLEMGGVGVYTVNLAKYLKRSGIDVLVASCGGSLTERLKDVDVRHVYLDIKTKFEFGIKVWKALPELVNLVRDNAIQLIHAQTRVAQVLASLAGHNTNTPFISTCHGFFKSSRFSRRIFPCWGEKVIAISDSVSRHLIDDFHVDASRVIRIYNGIELGRYQVLEREKDYNFASRFGLKKDVLTIGTIGRLSSVKGFNYLVSAFSDALLQSKDMQLLIVGEGPEENNLKSQVQKLGIAGSVVMAPNTIILEKCLSLFDIFCLPSIHEGLGLSLMEAMARGCACIASDVGGLSELITHETDGLLVPPKDSGALSRAILRLSGDSVLRQRLGTSARERAMKNFSIEECTSKTSEVYSEIIGC